jgi:hypothetical protein
MEVKNMDPKIELKLLEAVYHFKGMVLKEAQFKEKKIKDKTVLTLELVFSDDGAWETMVLVLDRTLTKGDYEDIYEDIIR